MSNSKYQSIVTVNELLNYYFSENKRNRPVDKMISELVIHQLRSSYPKDSNKKVNDIIKEISANLLNKLPEHIRKSTPRTTIDQFVYSIGTSVKQYYYQDYKASKLDKFPSPTLKDLLVYTLKQGDPKDLAMTTNDIIKIIVEKGLQIDDKIMNTEYPEIFKQIIHSIITQIPGEILKTTPEMVMQQLIDHVSLEVSKQVRMSNYKSQNSLNHTNSVKEMKDVTNKYIGDMKNGNDIDNMNDYNRKTDSYYTQTMSNRNNTDEVGFVNVEQNGKIPYQTEWQDNQPLNMTEMEPEDKPMIFENEAEIFYDPDTNSTINIGESSHLMPSGLKAIPGQKMPEVKIFEDPTTKQEYYYLKGYQMFIPITRDSTLKKIGEGNNAFYHNESTGQYFQNNTTNKNQSNNNDNKNNDENDNKNNDENNDKNDDKNDDKNKDKNNDKNDDKNTNENNNKKNSNNNARFNKLKQLNDKVNNINNKENNKNNNNKNNDKSENDNESDDEEESKVVNFLHQYVTVNVGKQVVKTIISIAILVLVVAFIYMMFKHFGNSPNYGPPPGMIMHRPQPGRNSGLKGGFRFKKNK
jgi:hypothetical protein